MTHAKILALVCCFCVFLSCGKQDTSSPNAPTSTLDTSSDFETNVRLIETGEYEKIIDYYADISDRTLEETILYVKALLRQGNSFYDEDIYALQALEILKDLEENIDVYYYTGYAYEIIREYATALEWYEKTFTIPDLSPEIIATLYNQIGHVYDLMGNFEKAYEYYQVAYTFDTDSEDILVNLGRSEYRLGNIKNASEYFQLVLDMTSDSFLRSEMYFDLSSIALEQRRPKEEILELTGK